MKRHIHVCFFVMSLMLLAVGCGRQQESSESELNSAAFSQTGMASYYGVGDGFHGRRTANGETFDAYGMTAAHKTLKFGTCLIVTNTYNGKKAKVRINDRGPYSGGRILDLSYGAAQAIGMVSSGTARVRIDAASCKSGRVYENEITPVTDQAKCQVYLSTQDSAADTLLVTVQSRVAGEERPCGKSIRIAAVKESDSSQTLATATMTAGNGRIVVTLKKESLNGFSQLVAQALNSQGSPMGESDQKELR